MGYSAASGWRINLEYDFINQDELRSGTHSVTAEQVALINNNGGSQEVEHQTINRYTTLGISYQPNANWNINMLVPYISRSHSTYSNAMTDELGPSDLSFAQANGIGDIKLIGSYQGILPTHNLGIQLGLKLPTGNYGGQNVVTGATVGRNPVFFTSGPNAAAGQALDTSLQPGTGSTDAIVGMYYYQAISQNFDAYGTGQFQFAIHQALDQANADYRPGNLATVSLGVRYEADARVVPQFQANITRKGADDGALADRTDTAGTVVYLSPGITLAAEHNLHFFAFVQVPVYSNLSGYQLFPHWTASAGLSYHF